MGREIETSKVCDRGLGWVLGPKPSPVPRRSQKSGGLANLDFLRAVAVGLVFLSHLSATMGIRAMGDLGHFGVNLFFVHTALVLMMSMERLGLSGRELYVTFMVRRLFRIYPLSILSVIAIVCFRVPPAPWWGLYRWAGWPTLASNLFLTQNLTRSPELDCVLWSLPFEIQMYAILPLLLAWALRFPRLRAMAGLWLMAVGVAVAECIARSGDSGPLEDSFLLTRYFPCFHAGVYEWRLMKTWKPKLPGWAWVSLLIAIVVGYRGIDLLRSYGPATLGALHGVLKNDHRAWWTWPPYLFLVYEWVFCAAVGLAIPYFLEIRSRWLKWISKQIARYSYGIYISHIPILWLCFVRLHIGSMAVSAALTVLLTSVVSVLAYHCLEDPAIRVGKRLTAGGREANKVAQFRLSRYSPSIVS